MLEMKKKKSNQKMVMCVYTEDVVALHHQFIRIYQINKQTFICHLINVVSHLLIKKKKIMKYALPFTTWFFLLLISPSLALPFHILKIHFVHIYCFVQNDECMHMMFLHFIVIYSCTPIREIPLGKKRIFCCCCLFSWVFEYVLATTTCRCLI